MTNKSLTLHSLCEVIVVIRLAAKEIEFGVFPNSAVECDAVSKCQRTPGNLRPFHLITSKPNGGAGASLWGERGAVGGGGGTGWSKGRKYKTKPIIRHCQTLPKIWKEVNIPALKVWPAFPKAK